MSEGQKPEQGEAEKRRTQTLRQEAWIATVGYLILVGGGLLSAILFSLVENQGAHLPLLLLRAMAHNIGHAWWITLDCRRRGRAVAGWRALAFWFGPIVLPIYLIVEYRSTAAVHIPLYLALESTAVVSEPAALLLLYPGTTLVW